MLESAAAEIAGFDQGKGNIGDGIVVIDDNGCLEQAHVALVIQPVVDGYFAAIAVVGLIAEKALLHGCLQIEGTVLGIDDQFLAACDAFFVKDGACGARRGGVGIEIWLSVVLVELRS